VLQCVAVCCSVLQCVAVCCSVLQCGNLNFNRIEQTLIFESRVMFTVVLIKKSSDELTFERFLKIQICRYGLSIIE